jgi:hypothetical protein
MPPSDDKDDINGLEQNKMPMDIKKFPHAAKA